MGIHVKIEKRHLEDALTEWGEWRKTPVRELAAPAKTTIKAVEELRLTGGGGQKSTRTVRPVIPNYSPRPYMAKLNAAVMELPRHDRWLIILTYEYGLRWYAMPYRRSTYYRKLKKAKKNILKILQNWENGSRI